MIKHTSTIIIQNEVEKLETIATIEKLLSEVDFSSEVIPTQDIERLTNLLRLLKEEELDHKEIALVEEIANY